LEEARGDERRATLLLVTASSLEQAGKLVEAGEIYAKLWTSLPTTEQAEQAGERLDVLEGRKQTQTRTAADWQRRGDQFFRRRRNADALDAFDRALAGELSESEARRVGKQRAHTLFRMRRYPEAVEAFSRLEQTDDVPLWRARSLARAGEVPQAVKELEQLAKESRGELGLRAIYLSALLLEGRDRHAEANRNFETLAANKVSSGLQNAALWHLGWAAYRSSRLEEAIGYYNRLLEREDDPIGALRARYWRARIHEQLEPDSSEVVEQYRSIAQEFPLTYYGWRAQARSRGGPAGRPPAEAITLGSRALTAEQLERPRILVGAGLLPEARNELDLLARQARGLTDRLELAQLYRDAGEYHSAQRLVVDAYTENLARGPVPNFEELWWHAWPFAFGDLVNASTRSRDNVDPGLVFSIMREESGYRTEVVSPSGARGLLQIMEETGERLARSTGAEPFSAEDLFEPRVNIDLGSYYLAELRNRFNGRLSATIASYNAGPNAVAKWVQEEAELEDDEWVEAIPYDQTRGYVKRVLRSVHAYQVLY
jgi:soluble lytic murein transglycosylase